MYYTIHVCVMNGYLSHIPKQPRSPTVLHGAFCLPVSDRSAAAEDDVSLRGLVAGNSAT